MRWRHGVGFAEESDDAITGFWQWWSREGMGRAEQVLATGKVRRFDEEMSRRLRLIYPYFAWELGPGRETRYALVVTAGGDAAGRRLAQCWAYGAPHIAHDWTYYPSRQRQFDATTDSLRIAGAALAISELRFAVRPDEERALLDVTIFHPDFASMRKNTRDHAQFVVLDHLLGEDDVVRWIGVIETASIGSVANIDVTAFLDEVAAFARDVKPSTRLVTGQRDGSPFVGLVGYPLKWIDRPMLDTLAQIGLPFESAGPSVLRDHDTGLRVAAFEESLREPLDGRLYPTARRTSRGLTRLNFYADQDDLDALEAVRTAVKGWPDATVEITLDPGWRRATHF